jgi:recombination associated protein RdgC
MWFKNLRLYRLTQPFSMTADALEEALASHAFRPCAGLEPVSLGWEAPTGISGGQLVHTTAGRLMVCARRQEKVLPAAVVAERLGERVAEIETKEGRPLGRRAKASLRDELIVDLLPRAFARSSRFYAYIDPANAWVVVDSASAARAEDLLSLLRESLGSLPVRPMHVRDPQGLVMTAWLKGEVDSGAFEPGDECELRDPSSEGAVVRCRRQDLDSGEVLGHLKAGKQVQRLAVSWAGRLSCRIEEDLAIKRLRFSDGLLEEGAESADDDPAGRLDADFALMSLELARFIPSLVEAFGGESNEE